MFLVECSDMIEGIKNEVGWLNFKLAGYIFLTILALLFLGYFLSVELQITNGVLGAPLDDAWIHFQFARNLSQGFGFSFNSGTPTPGSTAPLWTLMLAVFGLLGTEFLLPAILLSALFFLLSVWLAYGFTYWITKSYWAALLAGLGSIVAGRFLWAGLAAMETTAFAAVSLAAVWVYSKSGLRPFAAVLFGLASQLRPEGHALFAFALMDWFYQQWQAHQDEKEGLLSFWAKQFILPLVIYALIAVPYSLFSLSVTGRPLANTFYAKVGAGFHFSLRTLTETISWHSNDNKVGFLFIILGILPLWRRSRLAVYWLIGLPFLTALMVNFTWHYGRYTLPLIPLQMVAAAVGIHFLVDRIAQLKLFGSHTKARKISKIVAAALFLLLIAAGVRRLPGWAAKLGDSTREIQEIDVKLGEWLSENTPPDALIAVDDIGAIGFLSGRRILDMHGLVSPEVWPSNLGGTKLEESQILTRIMSEYQPDYMAAFPLWQWDIATNPAVSRPIHHVNTPTQSIIFQKDAYVYEMTWPYVQEAQPEVELQVTFGDSIKLLGFDLSQSNAFDLILYWESQKPTSESYDVFIHLIDENGQIIAQVDEKPVGGLAATDVWQPGDIIRHPVTLPLAQPLSTGSYQLRVGLYQRESGERLPVNGGDTQDNALVLDTFSIP